MKRTLIIATALLVAFAACKKKTPGTACYTFYIFDSISSNIPSLAMNTNTTENHCGMTDGMRNAFVKQYSGIDTLYYKHDTVEIAHYVTTWDFQ